MKKSNIPEARQTLKILGVTISSHIISFRFLPISGHFWATQKNQNRLIWSRKINRNWGNFFFFRLSRKERFLEPIKKNPHIVVITGEQMYIALFWWSRRFIYFFFFILLQFCYWQCEANRPRLREHLLLHFIIAEVTENILFFELDVLYIFDINKVCPCEMYEFIWFLIWQTSTIPKVHGDKIGIFAWQWYYFEYVGDSEILK